MIMSFDVGVRERHAIVFSFDKVWGRITIMVDGQSVVDGVVGLSFSTVRTWEFDVGVHERHRVRIDKRRPLLLAGARPQTVTVHVDGVLVAQNTA
ncbi:hypothetical protein BRM3_04415 [Brachybacterium huguangmaarense]|uniref:Uncharacterized protein n=1 Tax=Brachybacterium huguangmaarense TaxID=1652028 RepID=A0ABY6G376_9MICO|nr:hypothetical protein [Brachybacterium huguangmaarense]UYG17673.1 hypothetical protein BRM3_04415 [Brachybacterium huguangmaarense]